MKEALVTGKAGYAVLRDQRAWHGGRPIRPVFRAHAQLDVVLSDIPLDDVGGPQALKRLKRGEWIAEWQG